MDERIKALLEIHRVLVQERLSLTRQIKATERALAGLRGMGTEVTESRERDHAEL